MTVGYRRITKHLFRRTAAEERRRLGRLQDRACMARAQFAAPAASELAELGVDPERQLRVSPRRSGGYWRVEQRLR